MERHENLSPMTDPPLGPEPARHVLHGPWAPGPRALAVLLGLMGPAACSDPIPEPAGVATSGTGDSSSGSSPDADSSEGTTGSPPPPQGSSGEESSTTGQAPGPDPLDCDQAALPDGEMILHLDAAEGVEVAGSTVLSWTNLADPNASFTEQGAPPQLVEGALGGHPAVRFDGGGQRLHADIGINGLSELTFALVSATRVLWYPGAEWCQDFGLELYEQGCSGTYNTAIMWNETGDWGYTFLGPGQEWISYRFGTGSKSYSDLDNDPLVAELGYDPQVVWRRPSSIGDAFTRTAAVKYPQELALYAQGELVYENELPEGADTLTNVSSAVHLGGGRGDRHWGGDIAAVIVYARALSEPELAELDRYLECRFFGA